MVLVHAGYQVLRRLDELQVFLPLTIPEGYYDVLAVLHEGVGHLLGHVHDAAEDAAQRRPPDLVEGVVQFVQIIPLVESQLEFADGFFDPDLEDVVVGLFLVESIFFTQNFV